MKSSANILKFLVSDLLDLMYIKQESFTEEREKFSAVEACKEVIKCYEDQAQLKNIYLTLKIDRSVAQKVNRIVGDRCRYQQILLNIV